VPPDRPRLWESFKRALAGSPPSDEAEPEKARPSDYALPFLAPDEPPEVVPTAEASSIPPQSEPVSPVAPPAARESGVEAAAAPGERLPVPEPPAVSAPESEDPGPPRLARGLASFSRHNADREKKFRHILSDEGAGKSKKP
jgi:hypothetical protein